MGSELVESAYMEAVGLDESILVAPYPARYRYVMDLPLLQRLTYLVVVFHNQVFNGGLHQYFFNSYGQLAYETVDCLLQIKAFPQVQILQKALQHLELREPNAELLKAKLAKRELSCIVDFETETFDYLDKLDDEYYALNENLEELLDGFIHATPNEI